MLDRQELLELIEQQLRKKVDSPGERLLRILEKLLIPLAVALLAYYGSQAVTKISEGQLELARSAALDRKEEFRRARVMRDPKSASGAERSVRIAQHRACRVRR